MELLRCRRLTKSFGPEILFEEFDLTIHHDDRIGIIGPNGAGKSTLLKMLSSLEPPDEGEIVLSKGARLAYVPQIAEFDSSQTVFEAVLAAAHAWGLSPEDSEGATHIALGKLGFSDPEAPIGQMSGGWRKRLTLACGLVGTPDLVLFDEPTNHLDVKGVLWLEALLASASFAWVLVTHDRTFLERTVRRIVEVNRIFPEGKLVVKGNYRLFKEERVAFLENQQRYRESLANKVRGEVDWLSRNPKARTTKAKYRIDAALRLIGELELVKTRMVDRKTTIAFSASDRKTKKLIEIKDLAKTLGDKPLINSLNILFSPGSRIGILGPNGSGKTTLLRLIMGQLTPDKGSIQMAPNLACVYFDQDRSKLDGSLPLQQALSDTGDTVVYRGEGVHVIAWAKRFRFKNDQLRLPVSELSGGEQARLLIARLMLEEADVLLLDEPTNDLDIATLEMLEESLIEFPGAVVLVSHDRYMLDRVCTSFVGLDGRGGANTFADYLQWERDFTDIQPRKKKTTEGSKTRSKPAPKKLSYMEQREFDGMEETILAAEEGLEAKTAAAEDPTIASDGHKLVAAHEALDRAQKEVERLYERWSELSEKME